MKTLMSTKLQQTLKLAIIIIIIIHEFHRDASLETKLQGRYVSHIPPQL